jgi:hypothetical protein
VGLSSTWYFVPDAPTNSNVSESFRSEVRSSS